eukprot:scaffold22463_cov35-Attheya_sp.AAC.1
MRAVINSLRERMEANFSTLKSHGTKCRTTYTNKNNKASFPKLSTSELSTWIGLSYFCAYATSTARTNQMA